MSSDSSIKEMSEKIFQGWTLLGEHCPYCYSALLRQKGDVKRYCCTCKAYMVTQAEADAQGLVLSTEDPTKSSENKDDTTQNHTKQTKTTEHINNQTDTTTSDSKTAVTTTTMTPSKTADTALVDDDFDNDPLYDPKEYTANKTLLSFNQLKSQYTSLLSASDSIEKNSDNIFNSFMSIKHIDNNNKDLDDDDDDNDNDNNDNNNNNSEIAEDDYNSTCKIPQTTEEAYNMLAQQLNIKKGQIPSIQSSKLPSSKILSSTTHGQTSGQKLPQKITPPLLPSRPRPASDSIQKLQTSTTPATSTPISSSTTSTPSSQSTTTTPSSQSTSKAPSQLTSTPSQSTSKTFVPHSNMTDDDIDNNWEYFVSHHNTNTSTSSSSENQEKKEKIEHEQNQYTNIDNLINNITEDIKHRAENKLSQNMLSSWILSSHSCPNCSGCILFPPRTYTSDHIENDLAQYPRIRQCIEYNNNNTYYNIDYNTNITAELTPCEYIRGLCTLCGWFCIMDSDDDDNNDTTNDNYNSESGQKLLMKKIDHNNNTKNNDEIHIISPAVKSYLIPTLLHDCCSSNEYKLIDSATLPSKTDSSKKPISSSQSNQTVSSQILLPSSPDNNNNVNQRIKDAIALSISKLSKTHYSDLDYDDKCYDDDNTSNLDETYNILHSIELSNEIKQREYNRYKLTQALSQNHIILNEFCPYCTFPLVSIEQYSSVDDMFSSYSLTNRDSYENIPRKCIVCMRKWSIDNINNDKYKDDININDNKNLSLNKNDDKYDNKSNKYDSQYIDDGDDTLADELFDDIPLSIQNTLKNSFSQQVLENDESLSKSTIDDTKHVATKRSRQSDHSDIDTNNSRFIRQPCIKSNHNTSKDCTYQSKHVSSVDTSLSQSLDAISGHVSILTNTLSSITNEIHDIVGQGQPSQHFNELSSLLELSKQLSTAMTSAAQAAKTVKDSL